MGVEIGNEAEIWDEKCVFIGKFNKNSAGKWKLEVLAAYARCRTVQCLNTLIPLDFGGRLSESVPVTGEPNYG
jgi:hypothetical protein